MTAFIVNIIEQFLLAAIEQLLAARYPNVVRTLAQIEAHQ